MSKKSKARSKPRTKVPSARAGDSARKEPIPQAEQARATEGLKGSIDLETEDSAEEIIQGEE